VRVPAISMASWILIVVTLSALWAAALADGYGYKKKTIKCYQCAYSPGKTIYKEEKFPVEVESYDAYHKKTVRTIYKTRRVAVQKPGGWGACKGPFSHYEAKDEGIDVWECHDNCYTRTDDYGNIFRGCYKDEWGVNPNKLGCHKQAGSTYCFCKGDKCNNQAAPAAYPQRHSAYEPKHKSYEHPKANPHAGYNSYVPPKTHDRHGYY